MNIIKNYNYLGALFFCAFFRQPSAENKRNSVSSKDGDKSINNVDGNLRKYTGDKRRRVVTQKTEFKNI